MENSIFHKIASSDTCHGCTHANLDLAQTFCHVLWIELRFCMRKAMTSVAGGKILLAKTNWFFHEKSEIFCLNFTHSSRPSCHSTCPLPQRILLSKRTSRIYESCLGGRFAPAKLICDFEHNFEPRTASFQQIAWCSRTTVAPW